MPLFRVQDSDRPMFVFATSFQHAVTKWQFVLAVENPEDDCMDTQPQGVEFVADDDDCIIGDPSKAAADPS